MEGKLDPVIGARRKSSGSCRCCRGAPRTTGADRRAGVGKTRSSRAWPEDRARRRSGDAEGQALYTLDLGSWLPAAATAVISKSA
ncbi:putative ATP-dependent Clp protease ATP-binding subunit domain protein [Mycobacterium xenopi 3993]|nr:putative ATP-dependent Clp protease ATP-binding subunit domain protein [Mycobacterium xenopi 3993]